MSEPNSEPTFNLKVVVRETGLKPDTLRVWERRYGLPKPVRTAGGHRLYSERDIATVKWLLARRKDGLSISRAVALWRCQQESGQDPLRPDEPTESVTPTAPLVLAGPGSTVAELRDEWVAACLNFDEQRSERVLSNAFALFSPEMVSVELLQKGIALLGERWYQGEVTVQQEHFATELAVRQLNALLMAAAPPTRSGRILFLCPPEEEHVFGLLLLSFLLRRRGLDTVYLGANVPEDRLAGTLDAVQPRLVIASAQQLHSAAALLDLTTVLQQKNVPLAFGGLVFNQLPAVRERIPGHFLGERLDLAVGVAEQLLARPETLVPPVQRPPEAYQQALACFRERQSQIESDIWLELTDGGMPVESLAIANQNLARNLIAALRLGDMALLGDSIDWVSDLLANYQQPIEHLERYLVAYGRAARSRLAAAGAPILAWFDSLLVSKEGRLQN